MQMGQDIPEETKDAENLKLFKEALDQEDKLSAQSDNEVIPEEKDTEAQIDEIKAHQKVLGREGAAPSPLLFLRRKELELKGELLEAEKKAEICIADARRKAARIRAEADEIAIAEAKKYFDQEIVKAKKKAEEIKNSVGDDVKEVIAIGQKNIDKAVKIIMKAVALTE